MWTWIKKIPPVYPIFILIFLTVGFLNPNYQTANGIFVFLRRASPLAILAIGQMFVLSSGGFDLSMGSLVTFVIVGSSMLLNNDPEKAMITIVIMLGVGVIVGLINGVTVSFLKVPSLIVTLGMLLLVKGVAMFWSGGAPRGYFTDNFRIFGRGNIENVPIFGKFPIALLIMIVIALLSYYLFHKSNFGKQILAIGDNVRASQLSGVRVRVIRVLAFVYSALLAVVAAILLGGYGGISTNVGDGLEMQAVSAAVVGGTLLLGGKGSVPSVVFGAFTLEALFNLLNLLGLPKPYKDAVQGLIIIGAVAYVALSTRKKR
ncbi:MAG: ABC transporter permease [Anaerolinea sp.]|nr:ABC transporter permease [Anaerolinea sp.]